MSPRQQDRTPAQLNIPNDWPGVAWACYEIQWPDSPLWTSILQGLLSGLARGRLWDAETGSIIDVQSVGREVFERNTYLAACDGSTPPTPPTPPLFPGGLGIDFDEDEDMGCHCCIRIFNGVLQYMDCGAWVDVPIVNGTGDNPHETPVTPDPTYYACGKATAAADIVFSVASTIWDKRDSSPWDYVGDVEGELNLDLNNLAIMQGCTMAKGLAALAYTKGSIINADEEAWLTCQLNGKFADNADTATESDFNSARALMQSRTADPLLSDFWGYIFAALGWQKFADFALAGATTAGDCADCSEIITPGVPGNVYWSGGIFVDFAPSGAAAALSVNGDKSQATITLTGTETIAYTNFKFSLGLVSLSNLTSIDIKWEGDFATADWVTPAAPLFTDPQPGQIINLGTTPTLIAGGVGYTYATYRYSFSAGLPLGMGWNDESHQYRMNPRDLAAPWTRELVGTIVGYVEA